MRRVSLLLLIGLSLPAAGAAQTIPSPYRYIEESQNISLFGGYLHLDPGELNVGPQSAPIVGARYNIRFGGPLAGDVALSFLPSQRTIHAAPVGADSTLIPLGEANAPLLMGEAGLRFQITGPRTWHGLAPYVSATGGLIMDLAGRDDLEEELPENQRVEFGPAFAVGLSAGTDWFLTERISLRAAGQGYLWRMTLPEGLVGREDSEWLRGLGGTLGVALHF